LRENWHGDAWGRYTQAYIGVWEEFRSKTKSLKIQILEFISDKIEYGDSKREVMCIHFGHPTKKN
jgi:hypothetical protein